MRKQQNRILTTLMEDGPESDVGEESMSGPSVMRDIAALLPMQVVFQHLPNKTTSIYHMELSVKSPVHLLKRDIALRVKIAPEYQRWTYRGRPLKDDDTILSLRLKRDDIIFIEQIPAPKQLQTVSENNHLLAGTQVQ